MRPETQPPSLPLPVMPPLPPGACRRRFPLALFLRGDASQEVVATGPGRVRLRHHNGEVSKNAASPAKTPPQPPSILFKKTPTRGSLCIRPCFFARCFLFCVAFALLTSANESHSSAPPPGLDLGTGQRRPRSPRPRSRARRRRPGPLCRQRHQKWRRQHQQQQRRRWRQGVRPQRRRGPRHPPGGVGAGTTWPRRARPRPPRPRQVRCAAWGVCVCVWSVVFGPLCLSGRPRQGFRFGGPSRE